MFRSCLYFIAALSLMTPFATQANEVLELPDYTLKYSITTTADKNTIWSLWKDVENWKTFDERLEYSYLLDGQNFEKGAIGYLKAKNAPKTKFEIITFEDGKYFTESLKIPLYQTIELQRYFETSESGQTMFTHEVNFKGSLRPIMYALLCGAFKKDLKLVVERLKILAEARELKVPLPAQGSERHSN